MKRFCVNILELVRLLLPPHKQQPDRLFILQSIIDLATVYTKFDKWRSKHLLLLNMNSQKKVLESYLKLTVNPNISIKYNTEEMVLISLLHEGQLVAIDDNGIFFPLLSEAGKSGFDFTVTIPDGISEESVNIEINKFNMIDKKYTINTIKRQ